MSVPDVDLQKHMAYTSLFSPPFKHNLNVKSTVSTLKLPKKRKRGNNGLKDQGSENDSEAEIVIREQDAVPAPGSFNSILQDTDQFHVAGQSPDRILPGSNFPHAPPTSKKDILPVHYDQLEDELATLKPPLLTPGKLSWRGSMTKGVASGEGFRRRHLAALTSVLHRCISEGDYIRAGRAWAILIRFRIDGQSLDIRQEDRWGIGAEILYQRVAQLDNQTRENGIAKSRQGDENHDDGSSNSTSDTGYIDNRGGFQEAQDYYERLALQHPYRKAFPDTVSALDFCPANYALWIWSLYKTWSEIEEDALLKSKKGGNEMKSLDKKSTSNRAVEVLYQRRNEIAERLDELLSSPPHSDDPRLWRIRGMVALWIGEQTTVNSP